jgi:hypothetical protein
MSNTHIVNFSSKGVRDDMYKGNDPRRNASGYMDPTAYQAIKNVERERGADDEVRFKKLLSTIFYICDLAGFHIEGRLEIRDKKTGKVWR